MKEGWTVYLVRCADGTYYCGVTNDIKKRLAAHNAGKGAKYTRARLPVKLIRKSRKMSRSAALSAEAKIKKLPRIKKIAALRTL